MILQVSAGSADVDFEKDILPIFKQHCFECHGDGNAEGELSLDSLTAIRRGGHTSSPLLATELVDSELYLRITSLSEGYRMPKKGDPLPQRSVDAIGAWIKQVSVLQTGQLLEGAVGNTTSSTPSTPEAVPADNDFMDDLAWYGMRQSQLVMLLISTVLLLSMIGWLIFRFIANRNGGRQFSQNHGSLSVLFATVIGAASCLVLIALGYFYFRAGQLASENQSLRDQLQVSQSTLPPVIEIDANNLPMPPHPMHPPRLGGQYYRGNDERDDSLFNGGFYRTATIDLHLVNAEGRRLTWNDFDKGELSIEIVITRAPKATKELFSERVLKMVSLDHYCQSVPGFKRSLEFKVVEKDDLWKAVIPLPKREQWDDGRSRGMIYLMYGVQSGPQQLPRPHFAIRYDVQLDRDTISDGSELWMGSMYTLGGRVLVPGEGKILLDRWFDWRPIPVIEGAAATDRKLLGVEEHLAQ